MIPAVFAFPNPAYRLAASQACPPNKTGAHTELKRRFPTRLAAHEYLSSRGFLFLPSGWANGRWRATIDAQNDGYLVVIQL